MVAAISEGSASGLDDRDWGVLCEVAPNPRSTLVLRLCGEVGLRAAEVPRVRPTDVRRGPTGYGGAFLTVRDKGGDPSREAYLPTAVHHALDRYVREADVAAEEPVVDVSTRRIQMLVAEVAERAAAATGRPDLAAVTPMTLRRRFARRLLGTDGVDPRVLRAVGGWERFEGLLPAGDPDRGVIASALERAVGSDGSGADGRRLDAVVRAVSSVGETLAATTERAAIEAAVCQALAGSEAYESAWVTDTDKHNDRVVVRESAGGDPERFEGGRDVSVARQSMARERVIVGPDRPLRGDEGRGTLGAVPLRDGETAYGVLVVRAESSEAFGEAERTALADLGRRIATAMTASKRRQLLLGDTVLNLGFAYRREDVFTDCSASLDCPVTLEGLVPGEGETVVSFVRVEGPDPQAALSCVDGHPDVEDGRIVKRSDEGVLLEFRLVPTTPLSVVTEQGGTVTDLEAEGGRAELVAEFAPDVDVRAAVEALTGAFPSAELRRKQKQPRTAESTGAIRDPLTESLTERQLSVLRAAHHAGYFEWPRGSTAEELADSMGVSSPTLHNHLRQAQQKLLEATLSDRREPSPSLELEEE